MSVLVFADNSQGKFKKTAFELTSYGKKVAEQAQTNLVVLTINADDVSELANYGAEKILKINEEKLAAFNAKAYADSRKQAVNRLSLRISINSMFSASSLP